MNIEVSKKELIALIRGTEPHYSIMDDSLVSKVGRYIGGFNDRWEWNNSELNNLSESELLALFIRIKNSRS